MPTHIEQPTTVEAAGTRPKEILEFVGRLNSGTDEISIARMSSPPGWVEPGQRPEFTEYTLVLEGALRVEHEDGEFEVGPGELVVQHPDEWVRYSTPGGAEYVAICLPAFSPEHVNRDE